MGVILVPMGNMLLPIFTPDGDSESENKFPLSIILEDDMPKFIRLRGWCYVNKNNEWYEGERSINLANIAEIRESTFGKKKDEKPGVKLDLFDGNVFFVENTLSGIQSLIDSAAK